jgi:hypothetical protein
MKNTLAQIIAFVVKPDVHQLLQMQGGPKNPKSQHKKSPGKEKKVLFRKRERQIRRSIEDSKMQENREKF